MSYIYFGEDEEESPENCRLVNGAWHDDIEGQSLCGWAFDQGLAWVESERRVRLAQQLESLAAGISYGEEIEREACAKVADEWARVHDAEYLKSMTIVSRFQRDTAACIAETIRERGGE